MNEHLIICRELTCQEMATLELTAAPGGENRLLSLRVTPEQEIAIYAFFQINGWTIITEGEK